MSDLKKITLKRLIFICSSYGLKMYGTKELLLSHIKKYEEENTVQNSALTNDKKNDQVTIVDWAT